MRMILGNGYGAVLKTPEGVVCGFTFTYTGGLQSVFDNDINYRMSFDWDKYRQGISRAIGQDVDGKTPVVCSNRVSIQRPYRKGSTFSQLMKTAVNLHPENDGLVSVGTTRKDSALYSLVNAIGYKDADMDAHGTVALVIPEFGQFRRAMNLKPEEFRAQFGDVRKKVIQATGSVRLAKKPKFYKTPLTDNFQAVVDDWRAQNSTSAV